LTGVAPTSARSVGPVRSPGYHSFSPALKRFLGATVINMTGSGMLFAFTFMYLHEVRGLSATMTGLAVGTTPLAVVLTTPVAGFFSDHFGPRRILTLGCLLSIAAAGSLALVTSAPLAFASCGLLGVANGLWFPAQSALLAVIVEPHLRPAVSAFQRTALNIGAGLGGVFGGLIADKTRLVTFQWMFAINVASYVIFLAVIPGLPSGRRTAAEIAAEPPHGGFRDVIGDRFYVRLLASDIAIGLGFGFAFGVMPGFASTIGISETTIGILFAMGTVATTLFQIPMLGWVRGRSRMRCLTFMNATFSACFLLTSFTPSTTVGLAIVLMAIGQFVCGIGETILGAVRQPLTSDLAPIALIGRYYGLAAMVFQGSMGAATALGGALLDRSPTSVWIVATVMSLYGVVATLRLTRIVPPHLRLAI
jgi:MFS family permease